MPKKRPFQHSLPATYLALFSKQPTVPRRNSIIAVGNRKTKKIFMASAGSVGGIRGLYSLSGVSSHPEGPDWIDRTWTHYESRLPDAIEDLIEHRLTAAAWTGVLVPFVAAILVRGPDFATRFEGRLDNIFNRHPSKRKNQSRRPELQPFLTSDNTNVSRLFDLQRLLAPILAAQWIVMESQGTDSLLTNDLGWAPFRTPQGELGMVVPIGVRHALGIVPRRVRPILRADNGEWYPIIDYVQLRPDNHESLNTVIAHAAQTLVYGRGVDTVEKHLKRVTTRASVVPEPGNLGFIMGTLTAIHEFTWHRLVSAIAKSSDTTDLSFEIDWDAVAHSSWSPSLVMLPRNLPAFPPALKRDGDIIWVCLYDGFIDPKDKKWTLLFPPGWQIPTGWDRVG